MIGMCAKKALVRKAAPVLGDYQVGDLVSYYGEPPAGEDGLQWSIPSRII